MLGVLTSMYPIPEVCLMSRKYSNLTIFFYVFSAGLILCRVVWVVGG
jgi:hypothetical protein